MISMPHLQEECCSILLDAAANQEILGAKLPHEMVKENSSLHKRVKNWIQMHREFLPKENSQNAYCLDDEFNAFDDEQDDADEE